MMRSAGIVGERNLIFSALMGDRRPSYSMMIWPSGESQRAVRWTSILSRSSGWKWMLP